MSNTLFEIGWARLASIAVVAAEAFAVIVPMFKNLSSPR